MGNPPRFLLLVRRSAMTSCLTRSGVGVRRFVDADGDVARSDRASLVLLRDPHDDGVHARSVVQRNVERESAVRRDLEVAVTAVGVLLANQMDRSVDAL